MPALTGIKSTLPAGKINRVLRARLEKLACDFPLAENYFAWQAFGRGYGKGRAASLPPYLQADNYEVIRARAGRVTMLHANMTDMLAAAEDASFDRYIFLDAQDWMTDEQLTTLWSEITRTARRGARVLFRTAAELTLLPGVVLIRPSRSSLLRPKDTLAMPALGKSMAALVMRSL